jgi:gamma-glutamylcyclotransferase (GGCT)/AIG2-like uncharacterized protein YtfP
MDLSTVTAQGFNRVFVYETLVEDVIREQVLGREVESHDDSLINYINVDMDLDTDGTNYHTLKVQPGNETPGAVLLVTTQELRDLDNWEDSYERIKVELASGVYAWTYVLRDDSEEATESIIAKVMHPSELGDEIEVATWIVQHSPHTLDFETLRLLFSGRMATLKRVPLNSLKEGSLEQFHQDPGRELLYKDTLEADLPPLVVIDNVVQDGHHLFRAMKARGLPSVLVYDAQLRSENG